MFLFQQIPNLDSLFEDLEEQVQFDRNQILSDETIKSLQDYANSGLRNISYSGYINQINSIISTLSVDQVTADLQSISSLFAGLGEVSDEVPPSISSLSVCMIVVITSAFSIFSLDYKHKLI